MTTALIILGVVAVLLLWIFKCEEEESVCSHCGKPYEIDERRKRYVNKHLSRDYVPDMTGFGHASGDLNCYCTDCYRELFDEEPEEY